MPILPPVWKAVVDKIEEAIQKASGRADQQNKKNYEQQGAFVSAIENLSQNVKAYNEKKKESERSKRCRENVTSIALCAAAVFTFALAGLSACQLQEMKRVYGPIETSAAAATTAAEAAKTAADAAVAAVETSVASERARIFVGDVTVQKMGMPTPLPLSLSKSTILVRQAH
jgi:hypothetical protein